MKLSVKEKVMIWYSLALLIVLSLIAGMLYVISNRTVLFNARTDLSMIVDSTMDDIRVDNGELIISETIEYDRGGVTIAIFDGNGKDISGLMPEDFPKNTVLKADTVRMVRGEQRPYYVYDRLIENRGTGDIWVRGVTSADLEEQDSSFVNILRLSLILFPLVFIFALFGGWFITNRAFRPLKLITDTASEISSGDDLSKRINIGDPNSDDEVLRAAGVFDEMLDHVEESFENEKQFTNNASHELRTPTAVIMSQSEYALGNLDSREEVESSLNVIRSESEKMNRIVNELLTLARADRGTQTLRKEKTDISLLAEEAAAALGPKAAEKNIDIKVDADEGIYMMADPTFINMMYSNLIGNAIKYGKDDGHIDVTVKKNDDGILISIKDDGKGISSEDLPHIFDRFFRSGSVHNSEGAGLGLSLVKWIVDQHDGVIEVESELEEGSEFTVRFPSESL